MTDFAGLDECYLGGSSTLADGRGVVAPRWSRKVAVDIIGFLDVLAVVLASLVTFYVLDSFGVKAEGGDFFAIQSTLIATGIMRFMLIRGNMYDQVSIGRFPVNPIRLCAAFATGIFVVVSIFLAFGMVQPFHVSWFTLWYVISISLLILLRAGARFQLKRWVENGRFRSNLAVYGGGFIARKLHDHLINEGDGIHFLGVFDDRQDESRLDTFGLKMSGRLDDLIEAGRIGSIDQIIIALPQSADRRINDIVQRLEQLPVHIHVCTHVASELVDAALRGSKVSAIGPIGLLNVKRKPLSDWGPLLKKIEDYFFGGLIMLVSLPLFAVIALAIKATSKGPVFFIQKRHGLNHKIINVYKFRTMRTMENGAEVRQASKNDSRVTSVGWFLRRTSLDELPQVFNVLKGEMSLVGPRPHAVVHNQEYSEGLERYSNRHQVKPGITGWAQVNGFRGETRDHNQMKMRVMHDLHYITHWSIWFDLKIIFMTPIFGLISRNAY